MRILNVHKYFWPRDGASKYALQLADLLVEKGHEVVPFAMQSPENMPSPYSPWFVSNAELNNPRRVSVWKKITYTGRMFYSREAKHKLIDLLKENPVDIAHLHNIYHHISPSILPVLKKRGIPIVMTLHDYKLLVPNYTMFHHGAVHEEDGRGWYMSCVKNKCQKNSRAQSAILTAEMIWHHKIMKYYERYVDHFIAPSRFMLELCVRFGWPREKFSYIPHPVETHKNAIHTNGSYVAYIGRLSEEKGVRVLAEAAARTPEINYKIIGTGPEEKFLRQYITSHQLGNIELTGFKTGEELEHAINNARLLVVPSIWYENAPLSVLEPMAMGKVVIGSNIGGIPELLPRELLVPPNDAAALASAVQNWFHKPAEDRTKWGKILMAQAQAKHNPHVHLTAIEGIYSKMI